MTPKSKLAPQEISKRPFSLLGLPAEIHTAIFTHLPCLELQSLRLTNHYFHGLIPPLSRPLTHAKILTVEALGISGCLACVSCTRLRPMARSSSKMTKRRKMAGGAEPHNRFCIECGRRPLPGVHRHSLEARWEECGTSFVRCLRCASIAIGPKDHAVQLCYSCHTQDLDRERVAKEQERVLWEAKRREQSILLHPERHVERRRRWAEGGHNQSGYWLDDTTDEDLPACKRGPQGSGSSWPTRSTAHTTHNTLS